ncbi:MAG: FMN-dependent NADH-azoreductase [Pseudomonadota bacterium]
MTNVLYIEASPRGETSFSSRVAEAFLASYREHHPEHHIEHLPLFDTELPAFGAEGAGQKMAQIADMMRGGGGIEAAGEWAGVMAEIERLKTADKVIVASPMWNFSIPYRLKHWIDLVCQPGLTFYVNAQGEYVGMIQDRPLQLVLASGSPYAPRFPELADGTKADFQRWYLEHIGRFLGFEDIRVIKIEPTGMLGPHELEDLLQRKKAEAAQAAAGF